MRNPKPTLLLRNAKKANLLNIQHIQGKLIALNGVIVTTACNNVITFEIRQN
ncbi:MAG: hypothetical protein ACYTXC_03235 [Nostoc sp.]